MYDYADIEFAVCAVRVLGIIVVVAIAAYALKSRAVFVAGLIGSFLGYVVPKPGICIDGTAEGCFRAHLDWSADHVFLWGVVGAALASAAIAGFQALQRAGRIPKQYSPRIPLLAMTVVAVLLAVIRLLAR